MSTAPGERIATVSAFWTLPGQISYCPCARALTRAALGVNPRIIDDAELVVSELFANGCRHTRSGSANGTLDIGVSTLSTGLTLVSVADEGAAPRPGLIGGPQVPHRKSRDLLNGRTGRGLHLVASVTDDWGYDPNDRGGTTVWAVFESPLFPRSTSD
ncbi:ATP-binding protein [Nocardiopsis sp. RSe5-2]|uniref:ATP-binding protein n=1 Tax=Nocardiopsis endophytica TaxID=3018445 RepID=A0ABT4U434_9ACTN|nr:ATP-binding protein [Nocardiopsis endophytica]MDA2811711.1 ATP-binding protein [Nocardiopsis endophytica]